MLNLTFLFETCSKTEIQFIQLCELNVVFTPNSRGHWHQFEFRPACISEMSTVGCSNSFLILISLKFTMDCSKI